MEGFREWWESAVETIRVWISVAWERLAYGVLHEWDVRYFIFALGAILIIGLIAIWRRRA